MKLLTREEEAAHYRATLTNGTVGGIAGLAIGYSAVALAARRYRFMHDLTLPLKAFLVTSSGTFAGIIAADHGSRKFESDRNPYDVEYKEIRARERAAEIAGKSWTERAMDFGRKERYKIVAGSWIGSMVLAFTLVNRNKFLTGPQKLVQARVYAQFLTVGVLVATAAFEISDSHNEEGKLWETRKVIDPTDPEHKRMIERKEEVNQSGGGSDELWKDMVAAEEERIKEREDEKKELQRSRQKAHHKEGGGKNGGGKKDAGKTGGDEKQKKDNDGGKDDDSKGDSKEKKDSKKK